MRHKVAFACSIVLLTAGLASAQPQLSVDTSEVASGGTVTATITGTPGLYWALAGSPSDNGLVYGGVPFALGTNVQLLGTGFITPSGTVSVPLTPPLGNGLDLYFLQAATSGSAEFLPPVLSNGIALRPRGLYVNTPTFASGVNAGGARVRNVAAPAEGSDAATKNYVDGAVVAGFGTTPTFSGGLSAGGAPITNVAAPVANSDAATKGYVDTAVVRFAPTAKQSKSTTSALIDLEQTGAGADLLSLRVNSTEVPGASGAAINRQAFQVKADGGFVARGAVGVGIIPESGSGDRLMWYPAKAAFRLGGVEAGSTAWDDANIGIYSIAGGFNALASGDHSVASGFRSAACGDYSLALGQRASTASAPLASDPCNGTVHSGAMVIGDNSTTEFVRPSANNQFVVRAAGGYRLYTNGTMTTGVSVNAGGSSWNVISDRNRKFGFAPLDEQDILRRLLTLPLSSFLYKDGDGRRYIGPMAQDFHAAFGLGDDDTHIAMNDIDGVALASLKALGTQVQALRDDNTRLADEYTRVQQENATLRQALEDIQRRLAALEQRPR